MVRTKRRLTSFHTQLQVGTTSLHSQDLDNVSIHNYPCTMHGNGTLHLAYSIHQTVWTMVQSLTSPTFGLDGPGWPASHRQWQLRDLQILPWFQAFLVSFCCFHRLRVCSPAIPLPVSLPHSPRSLADCRKINAVETVMVP